MPRPATSGCSATSTDAGARSRDQFVPGWPYSFVAALETGRTSWVALLDAVRLGPADDATAVTAEPPAGRGLEWAILHSR